MASAELEQTTADIEVKGRDGKLYVLRASGSIVQFEGFLKVYEEGRDDRVRVVEKGKEDHSEDDDSRRLPRARRGRSRHRSQDRGRAAFHAAAAALFGSHAGQAHGGAGHRPPLHLCLHARRAAGARLRPHRQEAADPRGQGPPGHRLPGKLLQALRGVRLHGGPGGEARPHLRRQARVEGRPARLLEELHGRRRGDQGSARRRRAGSAERASGSAHLSAQGGGRRSAPVPQLRRGAPEPQGERQVRRLHRLLALSRLPLYAPAHATGRRTGGSLHARRQAARSRSRNGARRHAAHRAASGPTSSSAKAPRRTSRSARRSPRASMPTPSTSTTR